MPEGGAKRLPILARQQALQGREGVPPGTEALLIAPQNELKLLGQRYAITLSGKH